MAVALHRIDQNRDKRRKLLIADAIFDAGFGTCG
jgi:hypothetical protein